MQQNNGGQFSITCLHCFYRWKKLWYPHRIKYMSTSRYNLIMGQNILLHWPTKNVSTTWMLFHMKVIRMLFSALSLFKEIFALLPFLSTECYVCIQFFFWTLITYTCGGSWFGVGNAWFGVGLRYEGNTLADIGFEVIAVIEVSIWFVPGFKIFTATEVTIWIIICSHYVLEIHWCTNSLQCHILS